MRFESVCQPAFYLLSVGTGRVEPPSTSGFFVSGFVGKTGTPSLAYFSAASFRFGTIKIPHFLGFPRQVGRQRDTHNFGPGKAFPASFTATKKARRVARIMPRLLLVRLPLVIISFVAVLSKRLLCILSWPLLVLATLGTCLC